jgi:hypothetical protein
MDSPFADVYTRHLASFLGEGQQIATLATPYFQYPGAFL